MNQSSSNSQRSRDAALLHQLLVKRSAISGPLPWYLLRREVPVNQFENLVAAKPVVSAAAPAPVSEIPNECAPSCNGLDLLRAVSLRLPDSASSPSNPIESKSALAPSSPIERRPASPRIDSKSATDRIYVDEVNDLDVLCGRGGRSNHHFGNKKYRQVVSEMKTLYQRAEARSNKTGLSRAIVDHVCEYGGRFVKKDASSGKYFVVSKHEARRKTSQALRETKELKWSI